MNRNVANWDRILRAIAGAAMIAGSFMMPWPLVVRVLVLGMMGAYLVMTAVAGTCLGYKMMGMTTCPLHPKGEGA
jgi:hypothetical protein